MSHCSLSQAWLVTPQGEPLELVSIVKPPSLKWCGSVFIPFSVAMIKILHQKQLREKDLG